MEWEGAGALAATIQCMCTCMSCTQYWHSHVGMKNTSVGVVGLWEE